MSAVVMNEYYVYIMASKSRVLYIEVTNDIDRRVTEHKSGSLPGFTKRYHVNRLVWCDSFQSIEDALQTEKKLKGWVRRRKIELIEDSNPEWKDLADNY